MAHVHEDLMWSGRAVMPSGTQQRDIDCGGRRLRAFALRPNRLSADASRKQQAVRRRDPVGRRRRSRSGLLCCCSLGVDLGPTLQTTAADGTGFYGALAGAGGKETKSTVQVANKTLSLF